MINTSIYLLHNFLLLLFGVFLSCSFVGIHFSKKNVLLLLGFSTLNSILQLLLYLTFNEDIVKKLYPVITHLPLLLILILYFHKRFLPAMSSICTSYLCCHPARWLGILTQELTHSFLIEYAVRILALTAIAAAVFLFLSFPIQRIFQKKELNTYIFIAIPTVYYLFDYISVVYTDFLKSAVLTAQEFLPFFLCATFMVTFSIYYNEYEQKNEAMQKEHIIRTTLEQQTKEIEAVEHNEQKLRILRHDLRLLLNGLSLCIENQDLETAKKMIASYECILEGTVIKKYCSIPTINYIVSAFAEKCEDFSITFVCQIELEKLNCDEMMFSSVLSNALDNAYNAQKALPEDGRKIRLLLKNQGEQTLLSVKNKFKEPPVFSDGLPVTHVKGHGYGTKSIVYLTERMVGKYQFSVDESYFTLRIII